MMVSDDEVDPRQIFGPPEEAMDFHDFNSGSELFFATGHRLSKNRPLIDRIFVARGFQRQADGSVAHKVIPAEYWRFLVYLPHHHAAIGAGLCFDGVSFHVPAESAAAKPFPKQGEKACKKWLLGEVMTEPRKHTKEQIWDRARAHFPDLTRKGFDRAWVEAVNAGTTHESWRKPGPPTRD